MIFTSVGILCYIHRKILLIATDTTRWIRKYRKPNHGRLLRHDLTLVPDAQAILGLGLKGLLYHICSDIPKTLPLLLYFIILPNHLYYACTQADIVQLKKTSGYTKGTVRRIRFSTGKLQGA